MLRTIVNYLNILPSSYFMLCVYILNLFSYQKMKKKISITINEKTLKEIDNIIDYIYIRNRSKNIKIFDENSMNLLGFLILINKNKLLLKVI